MNKNPSPNDLPGGDDLLASDVDPRFDDAAVGTGAPRPGAAEASFEQQWAEMTAACSEWVRGKPMQALVLAAGLGFLLGRSGR